MLKKYKFFLKEMKVPANRQRLIFQGKLLNNMENLLNLKVF